METRGRKKKTREQKELEGTFRKHRDGDSPVADMEMPDVPEWLDADAINVWNRLGRRLNMAGILANSDGESFGMFCFWVAKFISMQKDSGNDVYGLSKCMSEIDRLGSKFGYTPADRASLKVDRPEKQDALEKLLNRKNIKVG